MTITGIITGKVLKQSTAGIQTCLLVKEEKGDGYVLCNMPMEVMHDLPVIGSKVRISGRFTLYEEATNEGQFDAKGYYAFQKIYGQIKKADCICLKPPNVFGRGKELLWQLRRHLTTRLIDIHGEENGALLAAMLLGERTFLSDEIKNLYKSAGALHVVAISGIHISLMGLGLYRLLCCGFSVCCRNKRIQGRKSMLLVQSEYDNIPVGQKMHDTHEMQGMASIISAACMLLYVMMAGAPPSAVRAFIMFAMGLLAGYWKRTFDTPTALSVSAVFILLENPAYARQSSFLLSFLAILAVSVFYPVVKECIPTDPYKISRTNRLFSNKSNFRTVLFQNTLLSFSVWLVSLPVQLFFFSEVSLFGIFYNLLIIPLMGAVLLTGILSMLGTTVAEVCRVLENFFLTVIKTGGSLAENLPFTMWTPGKPTYLKMMLAFGLLLLFCFLGNIKAQSFPKMFWRYRLGLLIGVVLLLAKWPAGNLKVTFLNVGQGDCICVELPNESVYLIDGGSSDVSRVGKYRLIPFLKAQGIRKIDAIFLSHADTDHINGIEELLEEKQMTVGRICLPYGEGNKDGFDEIIRLAKKRNISVETIRAGTYWQSGETKFLCLNPAEAAESTNASSMVLYMEYRDFSMLLTGDLEGQGEKNVAYLLEQNAITHVSLLKVAHHGSKNSSYDDFLQQCHPAVAVISCGENNSYGHPHQETLKRLDAAGAKIYRTDQGGAIQVKVAGSRMEVSEYRR